MHHIDASAFQPVYRLVQIFIACDASELHLDERGKKELCFGDGKIFPASHTAECYVVAVIIS